MLSGNSGILSKIDDKARVCANLLATSWFFKFHSLQVDGKRMEHSRFLAEFHAFQLGVFLGKIEPDWFGTYMYDLCISTCLYIYIYTITCIIYNNIIYIYILYQILYIHIHTHTYKCTQSKYRWAVTTPRHIGRNWWQGDRSSWGSWTKLWTWKIYERRGSPTIPHKANTYKVVPPPSCNLACKPYKV